VAAQTIFINGTETCSFDTHPYIFIRKKPLKFCPNAPLGSDVFMEYDLGIISHTPPTRQFLVGTVNPKIL